MVRAQLPLLTLLILLLSVFTTASSEKISFPGDGPKPGDFGYPPEGYEDEKPGTVLRSREIEPAHFGIFKVQATAYQLLYRTSGLNSSDPTVAITTVIIPQTHDSDRLVVSATPEDAASYKCRPSALLQSKFLPQFQSIISRIEMVLSNIYLQKGYVVTIPDYEGPRSAFGVGQIAGHAMLDAARATINWKKSELNHNAKVVGVGYSGGAIAAGWAAQLQPSYASDLNAVGFTFGGTPTNLTTLINRADGGVLAGLVALGATGVLNGFPELKSTADKYLTKDGKNAIKYVRTQCALTGSVPFAFQTLQGPKYVKGGLKLHDVPGLGKVIDSLTLGADESLTPTAPVFMFHATTDEFVPYGPAKIAAKNFCNRGANVEFLTETFTSEHIVAYLGTLTKMIDFIADRFSGKKFHGGKCNFPSISSPLFDLEDDATLLKDLVSAIKTLFGEATDMSLSDMMSTDMKSTSLDM